MHARVPPHEASTLGSRPRPHRRAQTAPPAATAATHTYKKRSESAYTFYKSEDCNSGIQAMLNWMLLNFTEQMPRSNLFYL